jgi:hypothetical protein
VLSFSRFIAASNRADLTTAMVSVTFLIEQPN